MSTAVLVEKAEEHPSPLTVAGVTPKTPKTSDRFFDQHPLVPVFIAGFFALALSGAMVGTIVLWLGLHHSGVLVP